MRKMEKIPGRYQRVDFDGNDWPFYKSVKETTYGYLYLWHDSNTNKWLISNDEDFLARNGICYLYIKTSGHNTEKDVTELDERWMETHGNCEWRETAPVTINPYDY